MAVQATHHINNPFPQDLLLQRNLMNSGNQGNGAYNNNNNSNTQQMRFISSPLPEYQSFYPGAVLSYDSVLQAKASVNTDHSGLTFNNNNISRKRSRDTTPNNNNIHYVVNDDTVSQFSSFAAEDILPHFQLYQSEIDAVISQHAKKIRLELEERQKQQARLIAMAMGEGVMKKLKEKEEEILRMGKLNLVLQERVKSLYVENQLLRDLAQTNEATANSLRTNLEQVLLHVGGGVGDEHISTTVGGAGVAEDVESCCGSSGGIDDEDKDHEDDEGNSKSKSKSKSKSRSSFNSERKCRRCGVKESCVLLLPCRHLCLCSACGSGSHQLQTCPVCDSTMTATLHLNLST